MIDTGALNLKNIAADHLSGGRGGDKTSKSWGKLVMKYMLSASSLEVNCHCVGKEL